MASLARYRSALAAMAISTALFPVLTHAQAADHRPGFIAIDVYGSYEIPPMFRRLMVIGDEDTWVTSADYPAAARAGGQQGTVIVTVSVDTQDRVTACETKRSSGAASLDDVACRIVRQRGHFRHAMSPARLPVASTISVRFKFSLDRPEQHPVPLIAPPSPIGSDEEGSRIKPSVRLVGEPAWAAYVPGSMPSGTVAVSLSINPSTERRYCYVTRHSGDSALDDATCAAVKAAYYEPLPGASRDPEAVSIDLLVHWTNGKARYELPSRDRDTPLVIEGGDAAIRAIAARGSVTQHGRVEVTFGADGHIDCVIDASTGSDTSDLAICANLRTRIRFTPGLDRFGLPVPTKRWFDFDP